MKIAILLQGVINYPTEIKKCYKDLDVIFSTTENKIEPLYDSGFTVVINKPPLIPGTKNLNYQVTNTLNGILKAEELGYDFIFKVRSDITIPDIKKLINLMGQPDNILYFPAYHNYNGGYLCDYMVYGKIDHMKKLWQIPLSSHRISPEKQITNHFREKLPNIKVDYILPIAYSNDIEIRWEKHNLLLNDYRYDNLYVYDRFK